MIWCVVSWHVVFCSYHDVGSRQLQSKCAFPYSTTVLSQPKLYSSCLSFGSACIYILWKAVWHRWRHSCWSEGVGQTTCRMIVLLLQAVGEGERPGWVPNSCQFTISFPKVLWLVSASLLTAVPVHSWSAPTTALLPDYSTCSVSMTGLHRNETIDSDSVCKVSVLQRVSFLTDSYIYPSDSCSGWERPVREVCVTDSVQK